jgi:hypothetical protein
MLDSFAYVNGLLSDRPLAPRCNNFDIHVSQFINYNLIYVAFSKQTKKSTDYYGMPTTKEIPHKKDKELWNVLCSPSLKSYLDTFQLICYAGLAYNYRTTLVPNSHVFKWLTNRI